MQDRTTNGNNRDYGDADTARFHTAPAQNTFRLPADPLR